MLLFPYVNQFKLKFLPFCNNNPDFSGNNCSTKKLVLFFPCTPNKGDDDIGSNSLSKIPNNSRILHVVWGNLVSILWHIDFAYFSTRFVIRISWDSSKIMLSSINLPFKSSVSCWMSLSSFATWSTFDLHLLMAGKILERLKLPVWNVLLSLARLGRMFLNK